MSPDPQATPSVDPREIDAEMIRTLYHRVVPLVFANFGALILLTAALWTSTERTYLLLWAGALSCWTMVRFALAHVYMRQERSLEETGRWTLAFAIGSTIAGCLWGSSTLLIDDLGSDKAGLITAFIMAALSAAAIAGYTNSLAAFVGFVLPSLPPYSLRLIHLDFTVIAGRRTMYRLGVDVRRAPSRKTTPESPRETGTSSRPTSSTRMVSTPSSSSISTTSGNGFSVGASCRCRPRTAPATASPSSRTASTTTTRPSS